MARRQYARCSTTTLPGATETEFTLESAPKRCMRRQPSALLSVGSLSQTTIADVVGGPPTRRFEQMAQHYSNTRVAAHLTWLNIQLLTSLTRRQRCDARRRPFDRG